MKLTHALVIDKESFTLDLKPEYADQILNEMEEYVDCKFELEDN